VRANKAIALVGILVGSVAFLAGLACFFLAIWTVGPDSARWVGTGALLCIPSFALTMCAGTLWGDLR
jgi:hypothetical protein